MKKLLFLCMALLALNSSYLSAKDTKVKLSETVLYIGEAAAEKAAAEKAAAEEAAAEKAAAEKAAVEGVKTVIC